MRAVVKKWGNSASVRISAPSCNAMRLKLDDAVDVREESVASGQNGAPQRI